MYVCFQNLQCIEIYIDERIGFYSLEMASDLELDPKPHHIIAFEDVGDCKNLCYLIQTHMEMLGNGNAFVVPQTPKVSSNFLSNQSFAFMFVLIYVWMAIGYLPGSQGKWF